MNLIYVHEHANSSAEIVLITQELEYIIKKKHGEGIVRLDSINFRLSSTILNCKGITTTIRKSQVTIFRNSSRSFSVSVYKNVCFL